MEAWGGRPSAPVLAVPVTELRLEPKDRNVTPGSFGSVCFVDSYRTRCLRVKPRGSSLVPAHSPQHRFASVAGTLIQIAKHSIGLMLRALCGGLFPT